MAMPLLSVGSRGANVVTLQTKLNAKLRPSPNLHADGVFGAATRAAVMRYQNAEWLVPDGVVGQSVWNALLDTEAYRPILHRLPLIAQSLPTRCWAASTAMITRSNEAAVVARTPEDLIAADGGLRNFSARSEDYFNASRRYASLHGLRFNPPQSYAVTGLRGMLITGPVMFDMLWNAGGYTSGIGSPGHMIVVVGIRGDTDGSGKGTTLRINDPWPPGIGATYSVNYFTWINQVLTRTYRTFMR